MWLKWFPWRYILRHTARAHGFIDPINLISYVQRFSQPSEFAEPLELLRAGVVFHARGLINTRAIQHNLDWIWPYWVERQFDPADCSFIPRAFSATHVNLTHRNWTALGINGYEDYVIVDPRGLITPYHDSWSLDFWILSENHAENLIPSREKENVTQKANLNEISNKWSPLSLTTKSSNDHSKLTSLVEVKINGSHPEIKITTEAVSARTSLLAVAIRPYNPEGVSFIHDISLHDGSGNEVVVNESDLIILDNRPDYWLFSDYAKGDVFQNRDPKKRTSINCKVGLATACAFYKLKENYSERVSIRLPLLRTNKPSVVQRNQVPTTTNQDLTQLDIPNKRYQFLYECALRTLVLLTPNNGEIVPGPYTYKRFWFRDAAFMLHALLSCGCFGAVRNTLGRFFSRQLKNGYFNSQEGEWDSNGQVLWIFDRFVKTSNEKLDPAWLSPLSKGANWIITKRLGTGIGAGLLPAGFSAEHLGPPDYYYWDNFWAIAGLHAAHTLGIDHKSDRLLKAAQDYERCVDLSIESKRSERRHGGIPAAPLRRMDAGAIGSVVASYPLQLFAPKDSRLLETVEYLLKHCLYKHAFFQEMIHSGINPYLTLHLAQSLLRSGDRRSLGLVESIAQCSSSTGQWPEAIHPLTSGGCMGDGQHGWAAAEWIMIIQNMLVREERDDLVIGAGIPEVWIEGSQKFSIGPVYTRFGKINLRIQSDAQQVSVHYNANWHSPPNIIEIQLPNFEKHRVEPLTKHQVTFFKDKAQEAKCEF
ncbi:MAG: hypothetical protein KDD42_04475 [Bdellovibrionales bacterium]|nr:hypothetical protein [Bdellovibrionales bacterium]